MLRSADHTLNSTTFEIQVLLILFVVSVMIYVCRPQVRLRSYLELFPEGKTIVDMKRQEREKQVAQSRCIPKACTLSPSPVRSPSPATRTPVPRTPSPMVRTPASRTPSPGKASRQTVLLTSHVNQPNVSPSALRTKVRRIMSSERTTFAPYVQKTGGSDQSDESDDSLDDGVLLSCVEKIEADSDEGKYMYFFFQVLNNINRYFNIKQKYKRDKTQL